MRLIVTADDFGRSPLINEAVLRAHRQGILTSASLMVAGAAADEAVEIARRTPTLAVGLHLVVVDGPVMLPTRPSSGQTTDAINLSDRPLHLGIKYALSRSARRSLAREIGAQFEHFTRTGLRPSHVDAHQHMHMHPAVFPLLLQIAQAYQVNGIRLPRDDLALALDYDPRAALRKIAWAASLGSLARAWATMIPPQIMTTRRCYGLFQSGQMTENYVLRILQTVSVETAEMYFHPAIGARMNEWGPNETDLATLLSERVRQAVADRGWRLCTYRDLRH